MIRNQLETSRINAVRFFKHGPCQTAVGLSRASTFYGSGGKKDVDGQDIGERKRRRPLDGYARP